MNFSGRDHHRPLRPCLRPDRTPMIAALHARLAAAADAAGLLDVAYRTLDTPVGALLLAATPSGPRPGLPTRPRATTPCWSGLATQVSPRILNAPNRLDDAARQIDEYFAGRREQFDLSLDLSLSAGFRRVVLTYLPDHRVRPHGELPGRRRRRRQPEGRASGRHRVRDEPVADRDPVPPSHQVGRRARAPTSAAPTRSAACSTSRPPRDRHGLGAGHRRPQRARLCADRAADLRIRSEGTDARSTPRRGVSVDGAHGAASVRRGGVSLLRVSAPRSRRRVAARAVPAPGADRRGTGTRSSGGRRRGPTRSTSGSTCATPRDRRSPRRSCSATGRATGTLLHRDLYGDLVFPLQVVINLTRPETDYTGGEFLLVEQRPRAQSRGTAVSLPHCHGWCSRPAIVPSSRRGAGPRHRCATASRSCARAASHPRDLVPRRRVIRAAQSSRCVSTTCTRSLASLPIAFRRSLLTGSLCRPSPRAMNED